MSTADVRLRVAGPADRIDVRRVLDAALLESDGLPRYLAADRVLVAERADACAGRPPVGPDDGGSRPALGALLAPESVPAADRSGVELDPPGEEADSPGEKADLPDRVADVDRTTAVPAVPDGVAGHVTAVAVRPRQRGRGVGTALVRAAIDRWGRLTAACDPSLRQFYDALGFEELTTLADSRVLAVSPER